MLTSILLFIVPQRPNDSVPKSSASYFPPKMTRNSLSFKGLSVNMPYKGLKQTLSSGGVTESVCLAKLSYIVAQGGCRCPIPGGIQGQAGCGSGQPGLLVGDPAHSRGLELDEHYGPFQPRPF